MLPKKFMAGTVPRFLRQARLAYLPSRCVIGSRLTVGANGANLYFDIVMLPEPEFVRMRSNVGLQHVVAPALKAGPTFNPGFVIVDARYVVVPDEEPDPETYARNYFITLFGLDVVQAPVTVPEESKIAAPEQKEKSPFQKSSKECTVKS